VNKNIYFYSAIAREVQDIAEKDTESRKSFDVDGIVEVSIADGDLLNLDLLRSDILARDIVPKSDKGYEIHFACVSKL
jgi:hypothetical protein